MPEYLSVNELPWLASYGGLFLVAFLAASLLPLGSEWLLLLLLSQGADAQALWLVASSGNVLGSVLNYGIGAGVFIWLRRNKGPESSADKGRGWVWAQHWSQRYGVWSLLLAWLPVVGDPLTLIAGLLRAPFWLFLLLVSIGKAGRYALLILMV